ncbi:MAG: 2'-5' RNA ligase family protein [Bacteriovoracaceae bacterium]|nr:2'-5' RNA ligase family protein [Bacteriovoracaceae bacterium]
MPFIAHTGEGSWDSYLAINLESKKYENYKKLIEREKKNALISRGESHITVITPVEFWNLLRPQGITIETLNQLAQEANIQAFPFREICLGKGVLKNEETYYVVIHSPDILNFRKKIQLLLKEPNKFRPENYYPHITIGFTQRDLHESDGVLKDEKSCFKSIQ